jgi:hypothetical protein
METGRGELRRRYGTTAGAHANKKYAEELVRQLEVVTVREPSLAKHVKSVKLLAVSLIWSILNYLNQYSFVNVIVTEYSVDTVLAELARCIALFPNLHTVQLHFRFTRERRHRVADAFKSYQYPSIRNVFMCPMSFIFLCACPRVRFVAPIQWNNVSWWSRDVFEKALKECPALEVLGPFYFQKGDMKCKAKVFFASELISF